MRRSQAFLPRNLVPAIYQALDRDNIDELLHMSVDEEGVPTAGNCVHPQKITLNEEQSIWEVELVTSRVSPSVAKPSGLTEAKHMAPKISSLTKINFSSIRMPTVTHYRPTMPFGNREIYFKGSFQFSIVEI